MSKIYKRRLPEELIEEAISILKEEYPQVTTELLNSLNSYQYTFISKLLEEGSNKTIKKFYFCHFCRLYPCRGPLS